MQDGVVRQVKNFLSHILKGRKPSFDKQQNIYEATYAVMLRNKTRKNLDVIVLMPLPPDTQNQKLLREIRFSPPSCTLHKDRKFGNRYVTWHVPLKQKEICEFKELFTIAVSPFASLPSDLHHFQEYAGLSDKETKWCNPSNHLQSNAKRIKQLAELIREGEQNVLRTIQRINHYVITHLTYGNTTSGLYSALEALENEMVDCGGFDSLFVSLCNALGIPARIVSGFWAGYPKNNMHAWVEVMLPNGQWIPADPSAEHLRRKGRIAKSGKLGFVGSDRIMLSFGCDIPIQIDGNAIIIDILQTPFVYPLQGPDSFETAMEFRTITK